MRMTIVPLILAGSALVAAAPPDAANRAPNEASAGTSIAVPQSRWPADASSRRSLLNSQECADLGGTVVKNDEIASICKSNAYCLTVDRKGQAHRVCLSAS
jgi:hypothetical protein